MKTPPRILIACIGNIFLGDDAFGVEVAKLLLQRKWPDGVRVIDFGIRGLDLTYALTDSCDIAILVDAAPRDDVPGTLYVIEPSMSDLHAGDQAGQMLDTHNMDPVKVLRSVAAMGGKLDRVLIVGCEPNPSTADGDFGPEMSEAVRAAVTEAVPLIESLVTQLLKTSLQCGQVSSVT